MISLHCTLHNVRLSSLSSSVSFVVIVVVVVALWLLFTNSKEYPFVIWPSQAKEHAANVKWGVQSTIYLTFFSLPLPLSYHLCHAYAISRAICMHTVLVSLTITTVHILCMLSGHIITPHSHYITLIIMIIITIAYYDHSKYIEQILCMHRTIQIHTSTYIRIHIKCEVFSLNNIGLITSFASRQNLHATMPFCSFAKLLWFFATKRIGLVSCIQSTLKTKYVGYYMLEYTL